MISMKTSKSFTKEDEILTKGIVKIYKEVLSGDRGKFPNRTWQRPDAKENAKKCIKYLVEEIYKFSDDEIIEKITVDFFRNHKLWGMLNSLFDGSPFEAIDTAYPGRFKPWNFRCTPQSYWDIEKAIKATKWLIEEKLKLTDDELKEKLSVELFIENNLIGMLCICFDNSPFKAIDAAYPGRFKPWDFSCTPMSYWNEKSGIEATKWLIEEKLKLTDDELKENLSAKLFISNGLIGMLDTCFNGSPFKAINAVYPNKYKKSDFKGYQISNKFYKNKEETL